MIKGITYFAKIDITAIEIMKLPTIKSILVMFKRLEIYLLLEI